MDFLKKNVGRIVIAVLALAGAGLFLASILMAPGSKSIAWCQILGPFLFFVGLFAYLILRMFGATKYYAMYVLFGTGLIVSCFMILGFVGFQVGDKAEGFFGAIYSVYGSAAKSLKVLADAGSTEAYNQLQTVNWVKYTIVAVYSGMLVCFGLIPLVRAGQKILVYHFGKDTKTTAK